MEQTNAMTPMMGNMLPSAMTGETASTAVATQVKATIQARYLMALQQPRDIDVVRSRLLKDCKRPLFAESARYLKPIGKGVSGPSIRFAEAAIRAMGNITIDTMTIYDDREKRIVRVTCTDLESNTPWSKDVTITKTVERRNKKPGDTVISERKNSYGDTVYILEATDDDILNKENALISKAIRTLGLRLIPADIIEEAMEQVSITQKTTDAADPDAAKKKLFDAFGGIGVSVDDIKMFLGHNGAVLNPKEMTELRALFNAIKDGETSWREAMESKGSASGKPVVDGPQSKSAKAKQQQAAEPAPAASSGPSASEKVRIAASEVGLGEEQLSGLLLAELSIKNLDAITEAQVAACIEAIRNSAA